jgi:hypothetical protein
MDFFGMVFDGGILILNRTSGTTLFVAHRQRRHGQLVTRQQNALL